MSAIVTVKKGSDVSAVSDYLRKRGIKWDTRISAKRVFMLDGVSAADAWGLELPAYCSVEDGDAPVYRGSDNELVFPLIVHRNVSGGSWAPARTIRVNPPWPAGAGDSPQRTHFECATSGAGVDILMCDSGIHITHDEFGGRASLIYDFYVGDPVIHNHGTGTSSCAAGNTVGIAREANVFSFRCLNSSNFGSATGILNAVQEAVDFSAVRPNPAVLNFSIVGDSAGVNAALDSAIDAGIVVVICAGNDGLDLGTIDGGFAEEIPDSIVVGGLEWRDGPYYIFPAATGSFPGISCTRYGSRVDVSAPSQWVKGATNTGDSNYIPLFGTSFGCAFTSGVVACLLQGQTKPTTRAQVQAVRTYIQNSAQADVQNASHTPVQLPNRRLYLDPTLTPPVTIPGL